MKLLLFLLSAILTALPIFAFPTPPKGSPAECADATYACQDLQSARRCGVVKTCIHDIWATMSVPDDNDEVCDICKEMVKEARDQLLSNMTQEEIKEVFEGSCKLLPVKIIAEGCIKIVDEIIPELVEMLASRMDPNMVCTVSGMCFPSKINNLIENHILGLFRNLLIRNKETQCEECTKMMTDVQEFLKTTSESDAKSYVEKLCHEKLPSYVCEIVLNTYFTEIYNFIKTTTPESMCSSVGICPKKCEFKDGEPEVNDELTCEFCEHVLEHIKDLVTTNTTMDEFKNALLNFCKDTGKWSGKCTELVNDYFEQFFSYIKNLDSKGMCTLMGLCTNTRCAIKPIIMIDPPFEPRRKIPLIKLQPAHRITQDMGVSPLIKIIPAEVRSKRPKESNDIFEPQLPLERFIHPFPAFEQDTECALCKAFSFYLEKDLAGDRSEDGVRQTIDGICDKWMKDYPDHCSHIVRKYSLKFQMAIAKGTPFEEMCSKTRACPLEQDKSKEINVKVLPKIDISAKDSPFCDLCKDAMNEVEKQLSDPATKQRLENLLAQVCNILPKSMRDDCVNFINTNIDAVIDILEQELKPNTVCPALGLCPASSRLAVPQRVKDLECDVCKDVVSSFRQKLQDPESKVIIETFLEEGCKRLPDSAAAECKKFVVDNIDTLMKILVQELDPVTVCSVLKICPASVKKVEFPRIKDIECDLCKQVVQQLDNMIKDKRTADEIQHALDTVCSYLPSSLSKKCEDFVNEYSGILINLLAQELDPAMVCAALNLCPASEQEVAEAPVMTTSTKNDVECELCKEVVGKLEEMVKDKKTEEEIKSALDKVCSYLPKSISTKCENFVNTYTDTLILLLTQELDPSMICAVLKVCPASEQKVAAVPIMSMKYKNDVECELCKEVVGKLEEMVKDKKTEEEIQSVLDKVCSYFPASISTKCENFVNTYTETLILLLTQELDPAMICAALKACPEKAGFAEWKSKAMDVECQTCQYALHFLQEELMNADTQAELKSFLKKVCSVLPTELAANCNAFVDQYGSSLLVLIAQEIDPSQLCYQVKMCNNKTSILKEAPQEVILETFHLDECSVCTTVVDYLDKLVEEDDVDKEITHLVEKVCTILPASFRPKCVTILEAYGPYILQMIGQLADSKQVCQEIDMCPHSSGQVHLIGGSKCTFGPSYWCRSQEHAAACKTESFCKEKVWKN